MTADADFANELWKWSVTNKDAIIAGVLSSWIVLSLQVAVGVSISLIHDTLQGQRTLRRILQMKDPKRIYVISGNIEALARKEFEGMVLLAAPDAEAAVSIKATLQSLYPNSEIIHTFSSNISDEMLQHDLVCVGGPINNAATRLVLNELSEGDSALPRFEDFQIVSGTNRYRRVREKEEKQIFTDYGFLLVDDNPWNASSRCVVVAGCDTNGVLAAAAYLGLTPLRRRLFQSLRRNLSFKQWTLRGGVMRRLALITRTRSVGTLAGEPVPVEVNTTYRRDR